MFDRSKMGAGFASKGAWSLWWHLALLASGVAIPALLAITIVLAQFVRAETRRLEHETAFAAQAVAQAIERDLAATTGALRALAEMRSLQTGDLALFHGNATRVAEALDLGIVLFAPDGQQVVNTRRGFGEPLPSVHPVVARDIPALLERGDVVVTDVFMGQLAGQYLYVVMVPVLADETSEVLWGLQLSTPVERIRSILAIGASDPDLLVVVADREGLTVARSVDHDDHVGTVAALLTEAAVTEEGRFTSLTKDGYEVLGFTAPVPSAGWTVAAAISRDTLVAPVRSLVSWIAALGTLLFATSVVATSWIAGRIVRALGKLVASADAMRTADPLPVAHTAIHEVDHVAAAHREAAEALRAAVEGREALLYEVNHRVKNSLAIIAGIIALQARQTAGTEAGDVLEAARLRVDLVATLHRRLYEGGLHNAVELGPFLEEITRDSLAALDREGRIDFGCEIDRDIVIGVDLATPIAVVVSELVVNAVKHAFPDGRGGAVRLIVKRMPEGIRVGVVDTGVGRGQASAAGNGAGVGTKVIDALVRQVRGRLDHESSPSGSRVDLFVPSKRSDDGR